MTHKKYFPGFTLLELLVVIAIIGILIALGAAAFSTAQQKARDAKRRGDIKVLQEGFEQYYASNNSTYSTASSCSGMKTATYFPGGAPKDPKTGAAYSCGSYASTGYCVCADIEDSNGNATNSTCGGLGTTTGGYYCLVNLQ